MGSTNLTLVTSKKLASLNREALYTAAAAAQTSNYALLEKMGVEESCYDLLKGLTLRTLDKMDDFPAAIVDVSFNNKSLSRFLNHQQREHQSESDVDQAIRLGIRQPMLQILKGISRREYDQRKKALGLAAKERGRIESLSETEELSVLRLWEKIKDDDLQSELQKLCLIANETSIGIDRIWNTIMEGI